jgi:hypothetical protein
MRRLKTRQELKQSFRQYSVYLNPTEAEKAIANPPVADFFWIYP